MVSRRAESALRNFQFTSGVTDGETIMDEVNLLQTLGQVSASETGQIFREFLRGHVREMICEVMATEVTELCGPKHSPNQDDHYRAGSSPGRVLYEGEREDVIRRRVRLAGARWLQPGGRTDQAELLSGQSVQPRRGCGKKPAVSSSTTCEAKI